MSGPQAHVCAGLGPGLEARIGLLDYWVVDVGTGLTETAPDAFGGIGFSTRF
ncbi:hypothetical protein [Rubrivirga sp.]|uniref:hypothetical protein n=1 Tax=Rubrivirga sp. TaxID=1885344 RepID=UPI003C7307CE